MTPDSPTHRIAPAARTRRRAGVAPRRLRRPKPTNPLEQETRDQGLAEWHAMAPADRAAAWRDLVAWVAWLHDRYELATDSRLPACWPEHPGLVEELWALRRWRMEIYSGQGSGQTARYWHAEFWNVVHAATRYAPKCHSGHKTAAVVDSCAVDAWREASPLAGITPDLLAAAQSRTGGAVITETAMSDALMRGTATPLSRATPDYVQYAANWWTHDQGEWIRVTDTDLANRLDDAATRLRAADRAITTHQRLTNGT